jgi:hypothetical protein
MVESEERMNMKRLAFLFPILCMLYNGAVPAWAQSHDAGLNLTEQSFTYNGNFDAVYQLAVEIAPVSPKSTNSLHVQVMNGDFRMSFKADGVQYDTIITKDRTLSQQGDIKYNFNKPSPESLVGMPPLPVNFESFSFLKVKHEGYYILQAGASHGLAQNGNSGKIPGSTLSDRLYFPADVALTMKDGLPVVNDIWVGGKSDPLWAYRYSEHRKLGNVWMPGRIECHSYSTSPPVISVYTLKSLHMTVAPETFDYNRALKKGNLVQSDNGKSVISFSYDPKRSLEQQHEVAWAAEQKNKNALANEQKQRRYNSSTMLIILGVGLIVFWYARRRMNRMREQTPRSGKHVGI